MGPLKRDEKREGRNGLKDECIRSDPTTFPSTIVLPDPNTGSRAMQQCKGCQQHQRRKLVVRHIDLDVACLYHSPSSMSSPAPTLHTSSLPSHSESPDRYHHFQLGWFPLSLPCSLSHRGELPLRHLHVEQEASCAPLSAVMLVLHSAPL